MGRTFEVPVGTKERALLAAGSAVPTGTCGGLVSFPRTTVLGYFLSSLPGLNIKAQLQNWRSGLVGDSLAYLAQADCEVEYTNEFDGFKATWRLGDTFTL